LTYKGITMHARGASFVSGRRSDPCKHDASLESIVEVARQELSGFSAEEIKALWLRLQSVLLDWAKDSGEVLPQQRTHFLSRGSSLNSFSLSDASMHEVDFVFLFFAAGQYPPLLKFQQDLAPQPMTALKRTFALMILREAEAKNCPGVKRLLPSFERIVH